MSRPRTVSTAPRALLPLQARAHKHGTAGTAPWELAELSKVYQELEQTTGGVDVGREGEAGSTSGRSHSPRSERVTPADSRWRSPRFPELAPGEESTLQEQLMYNQQLLLGGRPYSAVVGLTGMANQTHPPEEEASRQLASNILASRDQIVERMTEASKLDFEPVLSVDLWARRSKKRPVKLVRGVVEDVNTGSASKEPQSHANLKQGASSDEDRERHDPEAEEGRATSSPTRPMVPLPLDKRRDLHRIVDTADQVLDAEGKLLKGDAKGMPITLLSMKRLANHAPPGYFLSQEGLIRARADGILLLARGDASQQQQSVGSTLTSSPDREARSVVASQTRRTSRTMVGDNIVQKYLDAQARVFEREDAHSIRSLMYSDSETMPELAASTTETRSPDQSPENAVLTNPEGSLPSQQGSMTDGDTDGRCHPFAHIAQWDLHSMSALEARNAILRENKVQALLNDLYEIVRTPMPVDPPSTRQPRGAAPASGSAATGARPNLTDNQQQHSEHQADEGISRMQYTHFLLLAHTFVHSHFRKHPHALDARKSIISPKRSLSLSQGRWQRDLQQGPALSQAEMLHILEDLVVDFASQDSFLRDEINEAQRKNLSVPPFAPDSPVYYKLLEEVEDFEVEIRRLAITGAWYQVVPLTRDSRHPDPDIVKSPAGSGLAASIPATPSEPAEKELKTPRIAKHLSREHFKQCVFQLVDLWTSTTDATEYVGFLEQLIQFVSVPKTASTLAEGDEVKHAMKSHETATERQRTYTRFMSTPVLDRLTGGNPDSDSRREARRLRRLAKSESILIEKALEAERERRKRSRWLMDQMRRMRSAARRRNEPSDTESDQSQGHSFNPTFERSRSSWKSRYLDRGCRLDAAETLARPIFSLGPKPPNRVIHGPKLDHTFWFTNPWDGEDPILRPWASEGAITTAPEPSEFRDGPDSLSIFARSDPRVAKWRQEQPERFRRAMKMLTTHPLLLGLSDKTNEPSSLLSIRQVNKLKYESARQARHRRLEVVKRFLRRLASNSGESEDFSERLRSLIEKILDESEDHLERNYTDNGHEVTDDHLVHVAVRKTLDRIGPKKPGSGLYAEDVELQSSSVEDCASADSRGHHDPEKQLRSVYRNLCPPGSVVRVLPTKWYESCVPRGRVSNPSKVADDYQIIYHRQVLRQLIVNSRIEDCPLQSCDQTTEHQTDSAIDTSQTVLPQAPNDELLGQILGPTHLRDLISHRADTNEMETSRHIRPSSGESEDQPNVGLPALAIQLPSAEPPTDAALSDHSESSLSAQVTPRTKFRRAFGYGRTKGNATDASSSGSANGAGIGSTDSVMEELFDVLYSPRRVCESGNSQGMTPANELSYMDMKTHTDDPTTSHLDPSSVGTQLSELQLLQFKMQALTAKLNRQRPSTADLGTAHELKEFVAQVWRDQTNQEDQDAQAGSRVPQASDGSCQSDCGPDESSGFFHFVASEASLAAGSKELARRARQQALIKIQSRLNTESSKKRLDKEDSGDQPLHGTLVHSVTGVWRPMSAPQRLGQRTARMGTRGSSQSFPDEGREETEKALGVIARALTGEHPDAIFAKTAQDFRSTTVGEVVVAAATEELPFKPQRLLEAASDYLGGPNTQQLPQLVTTALGVQSQDSAQTQGRRTHSAHAAKSTQDHDVTGFSQLRAAAVRAIQIRQRDWLGKYLEDTITHPAKDGVTATHDIPSLKGCRDDTRTQLAQSSNTDAQDQDSCVEESTKEHVAKLLVLADEPLPRFVPRAPAAVTEAVARPHQEAKQVLQNAVAKAMPQSQRPRSAVPLRTLPRQVAYQLGRHAGGPGIEKQIHRDRSLRSGEICWPIAKEAALTVHVALAPSHGPGPLDDGEVPLSRLAKLPHFALPPSNAHLLVTSSVRKRSTSNAQVGSASSQSLRRPLSAVSAGKDHKYEIQRKVRPISANPTAASDWKSGRK